MITTDYRQILSRKLEERCQHNPRYSLRAYARDLGLSPSRLSEILSGRYGLSRSAAQTIALRLGISSQEQDLFCDLVESLHARSNVKKTLAQNRVSKKIAESRETQAYGDLTLDHFKVISDWHHFAILELTSLDDFKNNPAWIAKLLGISETLVRPAIERLLRLEMLEEVKGKVRATEELTATPSGLPSDALKKYHKQILEKAIAAIYTQTVEERDLSSSILSVDRSKIKEAKEELRVFRRKFCTEQNSAKQKNAVYCLSMQFFEMTQKSGEEK